MEVSEIRNKVGEGVSSETHLAYGCTRWGLVEARHRYDNRA
jgi:hypothetical protein